MSEQFSKKETNLAMIKSLNEKLGSAEPDDVIFSSIGETELISKVLLYSIKDLAVTIRPNAIQFSASSINLFSHTNYVDLHIDRGNKWLIVVSHQRDAIDSQRWCSIKEGKRESKRLSGKDFPNRLYPLMNWSKAFYYKAFGYLGAAADEDYEPFLAYKLENFRGIALSTSAREAAGVKDSDVDAEILAEVKEFERQQEKERKAALDRGEKYIPQRLEINGIQKDRFGIFRKEQKAKNNVPDDVRDFFRNSTRL